MKIVMVTSGYLDIRVGGVESHVYELSRSLRRRGHDVIVVRISAGPSRLPHPADVPLIVPMGGGFPLHRHLPEAVRRVGSALRASLVSSRIAALDADVVHFHDFIEAFPLAARLRRNSDALRVWTNHLGEFLVLAGTRPGARLCRVLSWPYQAAMAPSRELARQDVTRPPIQYLSNGYDPQRYAVPTTERRSALRARHAIAPEELVVLVPRRWAPNKGVLHLAEALTRWPEGTRRPLVIFAGGGAERYPAYQQQVSDVLTRSRVPVRQVGEISTDLMPDYVALADLTVIPSIREATSLSALESLGSGVPVLGTTVGGLVDLAEAMPPDALRLVAPADPQALLGALVDWVETTGWSWEGASLLAKETAERFSWDVLAESVEGVYLAGAR